MFARLGLQKVGIPFFLADNNAKGKVVSQELTNINKKCGSVNVSQNTTQCYMSGTKH